MKTVICPLALSDRESAFLQALQEHFSAACNLAAAIARQHHCTARVALHHLAYQPLRARFPQLGAQMVCNAIYTVARTFKQLGLQRSNAPLPRLVFAPTAPVFFDQRTLTLKEQQVSLFTLDGRLHFNLSLNEASAQLLSTLALKEVVLMGQAGRYSLHFFLEAKSPQLPAHLVTDAQQQQVFVDSAYTCNL